MIRRLRHQVFGHGQDGHHFAGYQTARIYLLCRCGVMLHLHVSNFISFEAWPPKGVIAPEADEWCNCQCHTGAGCPTQLTLIYDRCLPIAAEHDKLLREKADLLVALEVVRARAADELHRHGTT